MTVFRNATPVALDLYRALLGVVQHLGPFQEEVRKASVDLVRGSAFAGVYFRRDYLTVTIKSAEGIEEVKISHAADLDSELVSRLRAAYELCG